MPVKMGLWKINLDNFFNTTILLAIKMGMMKYTNCTTSFYLHIIPHCLIKNKGKKSVSQTINRCKTVSELTES